MFLCGRGFGCTAPTAYTNQNMGSSVLATVNYCFDNNPNSICHTDSQNLLSTHYFVIDLQVCVDCGGKGSGSPR